MRILTALIFSLALCGTAQAAARRSAAKPTTTPVPAGEDNLGKALYNALTESLESLESFKATGEEFEGRKISRATALRQWSEDREAMAAALEKGKAAKAAEGAEAAKDSFMVVAAQGLRGMDLVMESVKAGDENGEEKGWKLGELAFADLQALEDFEPGSALGSGGGGGGASPGEAIGQSVGFNSSFAFAPSSTNMNLSLNYSRPLTPSVDYGLGVSWGMSGQESGPTTYSINMNLGTNLFLRKHFLQAIPDKPWIVPFIGGTLGTTLNMQDSAGASSSSTSSTNANYGGQVGLLVFTNRNTAMNFQGQWETSSSGASSSSGSSTSNSTLTFTIGLRYML